MDQDVQLSSSTDVPSVASLEPTQHRNLILNLQKAAREATLLNRADIISRLIDTYRQLSELTCLRPHEWQLFLALEIKSVSEEPGIGPQDLLRLLNLHHQSTLQYQSPALFRLYFSLLLAYFSRVSGIDLQCLTPGEDAAVLRQTQDPASEFTNFGSCPCLYSATETYEVTSLPPAISKDNDDEGMSWQQLCSVEEVRSRIREAYSRCAYQLQESQSIWDMYISFELALLGSEQVNKDQQLETVRQVFLARLRVPHMAIEATFQAYSSFVTQHLPPQQYEVEMSAASPLFAESRSVYQAREQYEDALATSRAQLAHLPGSRVDSQVYASHWKGYISWQQNRANRAMRSKDRSAAQLELELTSSLFERAILRFGLSPPASERDEIYCYNPSVSTLEAHANKWKRLSPSDKEARAQTEQQAFSERLILAESIWTDYVSTLTFGNRPDAARAIEVCSRSVRALPTSIQLYATSMRQVARFRRPKSQIEHLFERVATPGALELKASQFSDLCLARLDCERELAAFDIAISNGASSYSDPAADMDKFLEIYAFANYALGKAATFTSESQDKSLRLETFAVNWIERAVNALGGPGSESGNELNKLAEAIWQSATLQQPENALVYQKAAAYWTRRFEPHAARNCFKAGIAKLERSHQARASGEQDPTVYESFLHEWLQFEHQFGSIQEIEHAEGKVRSERQKIWEAWYAASSAYSQQVEEQDLASAATIQVGHFSESMAVDGDPAHKGKRKASDAPVIEDETMHSGHIHFANTTADGDSINTNQGDVTEADTTKRNKIQEADRGSARDREHCSVLVANMAPETDAAALRTFLRGCGRIVELSGPSVLNGGQLEGDEGSEAAALVEFSDASGASSARTRDQKMLANRYVSIHLGWQCTLFVTNFPEDWEDSDVRRVFEVHGTIFTVRWPSKRFVSTRRFCYVQYTSPASAEQASLALDKQEVVPGRALNVALSDPARRKGRTDAHENTKELFVSGLPRSITEEELKVPFEEFGAVTGVRLLRTPDGKLRGLGFVDFAQTLDAQKAMRELNSTKLRGKTISVVIAENRGVHGTVKHNTNGGNRQDSAGVTAEQRTRSVRVQGLPADAQEALIQQAIEHSLGRGSVKTVFWTPKSSMSRPETSQNPAAANSNENSAVIEFHDLATAGKAVLIQDLKYGGEHSLRVLPMDNVTATPNRHLEVASPPASEGRDNLDVMAFVPRASRGRGRGRGRGGLGFIRPSSTVHENAQATPMDEESLPASLPTGQDRFRDMLKRAP